MIRQLIVGHAYGIDKDKRTFTIAPNELTVCIRKEDAEMLEGLNDDALVCVEGVPLNEAGTRIGATKLVFLKPKH